MTFPHIPHPKANRMVSHVFSLDQHLQRDADHVWQLVQRLQEQLAAENARLLRLLPEAPEGFYWDGEIQTLEDRESFLNNNVRYRVVYRLKENHEA